MQLIGSGEVFVEQTEKSLSSVCRYILATWSVKPDDMS